MQAAYPPLQPEQYQTATYHTEQSDLQTGDKCEETQQTQTLSEVTFSWRRFGCTCPLRRSVAANECWFILSDCLCSMMKHFYPEGRGASQDDNDFIWKRSTITKNNGHHMCVWLFQSPDLHTVRHYGDTLNRHVVSTDRNSDKLTSFRRQTEIIFRHKLSWT